MPRNGSGTYDRTNADAVAGDTITASYYNGEIDDIATALSGSIARNGETTTTAAIPFASGIKTDNISENGTSNGTTFNHDVFVAAGKDVTVGHTAQSTIGAVTPAVQAVGDSGAEATMAASMYSATLAPSVYLARSRGAIGTPGTIVQDNDTLGSIEFYGDDGVDLAIAGASIKAEVNGTPTTDQMPADLVFSVNAGGAAPTERMRLTNTATLFINDTSNANMTAGLTIDQSTNDNEILSLQSSTDVAHGVTTVTETDVFGFFQKDVAASGGVRLTGLTEGAIGVKFRSITTTQSNAHDTTGTGAFTFDAQDINGTGVQNLSTGDAEAHIATFRDGTNARFHIDVDGDWYYDGAGAGTEYDDFDDAALLRSIGLARAEKKPSHAANMRASRFDANKYDEATLVNQGFVVSSGDELFLSGAKGESLVRGAIWQLHEMLDALFESMTPPDKAKVRAEFVKRGLPTQILDWNGAIPQ